jgi:small GTP-binding protein
MKKKVCMLGAFAAGKTSLVHRFVYTIFSDSYQTTVGVNIEKKEIVVTDKRTDLIIWDLHGEDDFQTVRMSYLRGASGCIYVVDGTRRATLDVVVGLYERANEAIGWVPSVFLVNKNDLKDSWEITTDAMEKLLEWGHPVFETSAKTGMHVETAFQYLAQLMVG